MRNEPARLTLPLGEKPINLTQVLKRAGWTQSGGEAKALIAGGHVRVNGEPELRKRRQMKPGDIIALEDGPSLVLTEGADGGEGPSE
jgi:ribosome-associated protein